MVPARLRRDGLLRDDLRRDRLAHPARPPAARPADRDARLRGRLPPDPGADAARGVQDGLRHLPRGAAAGDCGRAPRPLLLRPGQAPAARRRQLVLRRGAPAARVRRPRVHVPVRHAPLTQGRRRRPTLTPSPRASTLRLLPRSRQPIARRTTRDRLMARIPVARNPPRPLRREPRWLRRLPAPARGRLRQGWEWLAASLGYGPTLLILLVALPALLAVYQFPQPRHVAVGAG